MQARISGPILQMETGFIQMQDGPGLPITVGDGRHSIMVDGFMKPDMVGCGYLEMNGLLPG